jgi:hypothetical protein
MKAARPAGGVVFAAGWISNNGDPKVGGYAIGIMAFFATAFATLFLSMAIHCTKRSWRPPLRWRSPHPCHVFGDRGLTNFDAELEEFSWIRGAPHSGLARLISRISWRISSDTFGLPPRCRDFH